MQYDDIGTGTGTCCMYVIREGFVGAADVQSAEWPRSVDRLNSVLITSLWSLSLRPYNMDMCWCMTNTAAAGGC